MLRSGVIVRRADERGRTEGGWLHSRHTFSFADYNDPKHMGIGPLRVLNDDRVEAGQGFGPHAHRDMEIVSYVLQGALEHQDSAGHKGLIKAGEAQFMRAGTGVVHSEMNASASEPVHFLQMWFVPRTQALKPAYDQRMVEFPAKGGWVPIASPGMGGMEMDSDAALMAAKVAAGSKVGHVVHGGRQAYLFVIAGKLTLGSETLGEGDAALVRDGVVGVRALEGSHALLFDLPG